MSLLLFAACKKDDNGPLLTSKEKMLVNKTWKVDSLTVPKISDVTKDSSMAKECSKDALLDFNGDKTFSFTDPSKACDSSLVPYGKGTWSLKISNDTLFLNGPKKLSWKILASDNNKLKAVYRDSLSPAKIQMKTITLK